LNNKLAKPLLPVADCLIIFYVLDRISHIGISDIGIVISLKTGERIMEVLGADSRWNVNFTYVYNPSRAVCPSKG
jgi:dTDP-glucose pyrophosphorylase